MRPHQGTSQFPTKGTARLEINPSHPIPAVPVPFGLRSGSCDKWLQANTVHRPRVPEKRMGSGGRTRHAWDAWGRSTLSHQQPLCLRCVQLSLIFIKQKSGLSIANTQLQHNQKLAPDNQKVCTVLARFILTFFCQTFFLTSFQNNEASACYSK